MSLQSRLAKLERESATLWTRQRRGILIYRCEGVGTLPESLQGGDCGCGKSDGRATIVIARVNVDIDRL